MAPRIRLLAAASSLLTMIALSQTISAEGFKLYGPDLARTEARRQMAWLTADTLVFPPTPEDAIGLVGDAFNARWLGGYINSLAPDFHFDSNQPDFRRRHPHGFDRWDELIAARNLFFGGTNHAGVELPPARALHVDIGSLIALPDPAHRDSIEWYRIVIAPSYHLAVTLESGERIDATTGWQEFQLARLRLASYAGHSERWLIRRWVEHVEPLPDSLKPNHPPRAAATAAAPDTAEAAPLTLAFARVPNPARNPISFLCSVPRGPDAEFEMIDIAGRRVVRRNVAPHHGFQRVAVDGASLAPGVYWMRLRQGANVTTAKVVVLR